MKRTVHLISRYAASLFSLIVGILLSMASNGDSTDDTGGNNDSGKKSGTVKLSLRSPRASNIDDWTGTIHWVGQYLDVDDGGPGSRNPFDIPVNYDVSPDLIPIDNSTKWYSTMTHFQSGLRPGRWLFSYYITAGTSASCNSSGLTLGPSETMIVNFTQGRPSCSTGLTFP